MSKGGAGKVYFVLYLAVILELLIIIVERDEAEEHLMRKQKESMKIVQSILAQLQTGAGTEGLSTRPQDQIVLKDASWANLPGMDLIKEERQYPVEVGVTDVMNDISKVVKDDRLDPDQKERRLRDFALASNVRELFYQVWYISEKENLPSTFPTDTEIDQIMRRPDRGIGFVSTEGWTLKGYKGLVLDTTWAPVIPYDDATKARDWFRNPTQIPPYKALASVGAIDQFWPKSDSLFVYDHARTIRAGTNSGQSLKARIFVASFKPPSGIEGTYKLHFYSRTNKILGIKPAATSQSVETSDDEKVNIGTVQLTVKDLRNVQKELERELDPVVGELTDKLNAGMKPSEYREEIKKRVQTLHAEDKSDEASAAQLYGYIQMILKPGAYQDIDGNRASMGFPVKVVRPNIPTAEPKIADLKTVVRVFSKLSKLSLPFQVSPATGSTELTKKPGNASISGGSGSASTAAGGVQWVTKTLEIPIDGNLAPQDEPYVFELTQRTPGKVSEPVACSVYVYQSKLLNEAEVISALEASWGDAIELVATTASGSTIKPDEFIMQFGMGGGSQVAPLRKLSVGASDNVIVPAGTDKVSLSVAWKDPQSGEVVELFSGSGEVGLKKPTIITNDLKVDPIFSNQDGEFKVTGIMVRAPKIGAEESAEIGDVEVSVQSSSVRDLKSNNTYKVVVVGKPRKTAGSTYEVTLKLQGGKFPLTKGQVKGNAQLQISATARAQGATSKPRLKTQPISISN